VTSSTNGNKPKKKKTPKHKETNTPAANISPQHRVHHTTTSKSRATIGKKAHASARPTNPDPLPTS
jgi:hypothetical protein